MVTVVKIVQNNFPGVVSRPLLVRGPSTKTGMVDGGRFVAKQ